MSYAGYTSMSTPASTPTPETEHTPPALDLHAATDSAPSPVLTGPGDAPPPSFAPASIASASSDALTSTPVATPSLPGAIKGPGRAGEGTYAKGPAGGWTKTGEVAGDSAYSASAKIGGEYGGEEANASFRGVGGLEARPDGVLEPTRTRYLAESDRGAMTVGASDGKLTRDGRALDTSGGASSLIGGTQNSNIFAMDAGGRVLAANAMQQFRREDINSPLPSTMATAAADASSHAPPSGVTPGSAYDGSLVLPLTSSTPSSSGAFAPSSSSLYGGDPSTPASHSTPFASASSSSLYGGDPSVPSSPSTPSTHAPASSSSAYDSSLILPVASSTPSTAPSSTSLYGADPSPSSPVSPTTPSTHAPASSSSAYDSSLILPVASSTPSTPPSSSSLYGADPSPSTPTTPTTPSTHAPASSSSAYDSSLILPVASSTPSEPVSSSSPYAASLSPSTPSTHAPVSSTSPYAASLSPSGASSTPSEPVSSSSPYAASLSPSTPATHAPASSSSAYDASLLLPTEPASTGSSPATSSPSSLPSAYGSGLYSGQIASIAASMAGPTPATSDASTAPPTASGATTPPPASMGPAARKAYFHHSSFFAGQDVAAAGEIATNSEGYVKSVSNNSGHYKPGASNLLQSLDGLDRMGANLDAAKAVVIGGDGGGNREYNANGFLQSQGNEKLLTDRSKVMDELLKKTPKKP